MVKYQSIGLVKSTVRTVNGKTTVETRYYISSLSNNAELFGQSKVTGELKTRTLGT